MNRHREQAFKEKAERLLFLLIHDLTENHVAVTDEMRAWYRQASNHADAVFEKQRRRAMQIKKAERKQRVKDALKDLDDGDEQAVMELLAQRRQNR